MKRLAGLFEVVRVVVVVFLLVFLTQRFVIQPFQIEGKSMEPSLHSGELILTEKVSYLLHQPRRGDIIVFRYPNSPDTDYVKRIIGLPGETISISGGYITIDNQVLEEKYLSSRMQTLIGNNSSSAYQTTLAADQYFVMGDNRLQSSDSRDWGALQRKYIIGRSAFILYSGQSTQAAPSASY